MRKNNQNQNLLLQLGGKMPPQDIELERAVLGAILIESKLAMKATGGLFKPEIFYFDTHQHIAESIVEIVKDGGKVDLLTVMAKLKENKQLETVGGLSALTQLTRGVNSSAHIDQHIQIIYEHYIKRSLIHIAMQTEQSCYQPETDAFDAMQEAAKSISGLFEGVNNGNQMTMKEAVAEAAKEIFARKNQQGITGIDYGYRALNEATGGAVPGELIIIAARPGMGKTAFAINLACKMAEKVGVGFLTMEMKVNGPGEIMDRIVGMYSGLDTMDIKRFVGMEGKEHKINEALGKAYELNITFDSTSRPNEQQIRQKLFAMHDQGCKVFFVDYLQMVQSASKSKMPNRNNEIGEVCAVLKQTAKDLNVPIILLCQLSRKVEETTNKIPNLSHLRDSGEIEQYGNIIFGLYRPAYYNINTYSDCNTKNLLVAIPLKNRSGSLAEIWLTYNLSSQLISNYQEVSLDEKASILKEKKNLSFFDEG
jgi:replicative DNA helicase